MADHAKSRYVAATEGGDAYSGALYFHVFVDKSRPELSQVDSNTSSRLVRSSSPILSAGSNIGIEL